MAMNFGNLAMTAAGSATSSAIGALWNTIQSKLANGGRDTNCKFYYDYNAGGSVLQVAARYLAGGAVSELKDLADNSFKNLLNGKKDKEWKESEWSKDTYKENVRDKNNYGRFQTEGGAVLALDEWGCICTEALMLGAKLDHNVSLTQIYPDFDPTHAPSKQITKTISSQWMVWYDTSALVTTSSDKNVVITKVQGRDYSRKELVSNGDIKINVSGQITSGKPDVYPSSEVQKFLTIMKYKGVIKVNNEMLDQYGITHIIITDFNLNPKEGYLSVQPYSFSAIGLQPPAETTIFSDTVQSYSTELIEIEKEDNSNQWLDLLNKQLANLTVLASDLESQGTALATGMLDNVL